ncbi:MAG: NAD kinase [Bacteroidales bacterium]|nr:NAD kinase [Bacteroidales bacterium]
MKIAVYIRYFDSESLGFIQMVLQSLREKNCELVLYEPFVRDCGMAEIAENHASFSTPNELDASIDYLFSLGGDGTFLDAANLIADKNIPLVGINTGRIGFLTSINKGNFKECLEWLFAGDFELEERSLLHVDCDAPLVIPSNFALNDVTIHPSIDGSINSISVWMDGQKINTYWADGLIVATPTGSTAYSLSCGGPILPPSAAGMVITPIASHSLSVRPIVLPDSAIITLMVESRTKQFSLSLDSHKVVLPHLSKITITKEKFKIRSVRFHSADFFSVIREKLLWGIDKRNL